MKKIVLVTFILSIFLNTKAQEKINVLKGGISILKFNGLLKDYYIDQTDYYNIKKENDYTIRIWSKSSILNPPNTTLHITEGNITHSIQIYFSETGDYNSTNYDFSNSKTFVDNTPNIEEKINENNDLPIILSRKTIKEDKKNKKLLAIENKKQLVEKKRLQIFNEKEEKLTQLGKEKDTNLQVALEKQKKLDEKIQKQEKFEQFKKEELTKKQEAINNQKKFEEEQIPENKQVINVQKNDKSNLAKLIAKEKARQAAFENVQKNKKNIALQEASINKIEDKKIITPVVEVKNDQPNNENLQATYKNIFPTINFNLPPKGQIFEPMSIKDSNIIDNIEKKIIPSLDSKIDPIANIELENIKIYINRINRVNDIVYLHCTLYNNTSDYFLVGSVLLRIIDLSVNKKIQLNPYHISSFPIIPGNSSGEFIYAMKAEKNISPNSMGILTIRERQTNKKFEINFSGDYYTALFNSNKK